MVGASIFALGLVTLVAGATAEMRAGEAASARSLIVPAASSNAHRPDAYGNYGGLKRSHTLPSARGSGSGVPSISPFIPPRQFPGDGAARRQPYPYQYYQGTQRGNYGCDWLARRAIDTDNLNWWTRYRSCSRNKTDFESPSYSPQR